MQNFKNGFPFDSINGTGGGGPGDAPTPVAASYNVYCNVHGLHEESCIGEY